MDQNDHETRNHNVQQQINKKHSFGKNFLGGILGGVLSAALVIGLFFNSGTPDSGSENNQLNETGSNNSPPVTTVSTDEEGELQIDKISQTIVGVVNVQKQNIWEQSGDENVGSGIIYKQEDDKAYIVTNNHVVDGAEEVEVDINKEERLKAKVLGTDELSDLAVLEIDGEQIDYVAELGTSEDLDVGVEAFAIGNPLGLDFSGSVTKGIISGLDRSVKVDTSRQNNHPDWEMQVIQTDAAINPGNSGGALVNPQGQVVGINSMKIAQAAVEGIGFAIPIDTALPIMEQLEHDGEVKRPFIGIAAVSLHEVPREQQQNITLPDDLSNGVVIANTEEDSPAKEAGLKQFDVVTKINDQEIETMLDLRKYLYEETTIGDSITLEIYRNDEQMEIELELTK